MPISGTDTTGTFMPSYATSTADPLYTRFTFPYTIDTSNTWSTGVSPAFQSWEVSTTDLIELFKRVEDLENKLKEIPHKVYKTISEHIALDLSEEEFIRLLMEGE